MYIHLEEKDLRLTNKHVCTQSKRKVQLLFILSLDRKSAVAKNNICLNLFTLRAC
jgi:hypothetical protein